MRLRAHTGRTVACFVALALVAGGSGALGGDCKLHPNKYQYDLPETREDVIGTHAIQVLQAGFGLDGTNLVLAVAYRRDFGGHTTLDGETPIEFVFESGRRLKLKPWMESKSFHGWGAVASPVIRGQYMVTREEVELFRSDTLKTARFSARDSEGVVRVAEFSVSAGRNKTLQKHADCLLSASAHQK